VSEPHYHINVFWSEKDGRWIADVPDLKYCSAHGSTPLEAVEEVRVAIDVWLETAREEGLDIPKPKYRPEIYSTSRAA
jgi:predicted RNase H-like HicB family nuclease